MTILEIAETVQEMTGGCEIVHTPPRPGDFPGKEISNERALEELGWKAETSFREGVRRYVEWVRGSTRAARPDPRHEALAATATATPRGGRCWPAPARAEERPPRVLVLTADIGEGHDLPARMIKEDVEQEIPGAEVEIVNGLQAMGRICLLGGARRLPLHLPLDALAVRHPVLADHQVRADPLARCTTSATCSAPAA